MSEIPTNESAPAAPTVESDGPLGLTGEEYVRYMRKALCPPEMVDEDGTLNDEYFQPKTDASDGVVWTEEAIAKLHVGIERFGIGAWSVIRQNLLLHWDELAIKLKVCRLLGIQDLTEYMGKKLTAANMVEEKAKNEELGKKEGTWHAGVRVSSRYGWLHDSTANSS
mmetsp:Transcript_11280/g.20850  ORF Transcript_11280/g.20850 Transcript_11280/m.20850 type:complete len:167 (+) Transcript_11280:79-579(+)